MQFGNRKTATSGRKLILSLFAISFISFGCTNDSGPPIIQTDIPFRPEGLLDFVTEDGTVVTRIAIEVAESDSAQARGLMERRSLPARGGMLFIDQEPSERSFWMKNTPMPLDIIFVRSDSTIANIVKKTTPFSSEKIKSIGKAKFVVEVRAGFTDRYRITDSLSITWKRRQ